jgi:hypothetical protein
MGSHANSWDELVETSEELLLLLLEYWTEIKRGCEFLGGYCYLSFIVSTIGSAGLDAGAVEWCQYGAMESFEDASAGCIPYLKGAKLTISIFTSLARLRILPNLLVTR